MSHFLPQIRTTAVGVLLALLLLSPLVAQGQTPIKAEEARMQIIREVPISTEVTGKLESVNPGKEGLYVKQGDLMIEVADDFIRKEVAEAQKKSDSVVEIEFTVVALAKAEVDLKQRVEANLKYKSFSENEIRQTELEVQKSKASLAKAREDKEILGLTLETKTAQLAQYQVFAPFDGLVTKIHRWPGQSVRPGDPVITITDMSLLRAVLKIDYKRRDEVFVGDSVEISIDATGKSIKPEATDFEADRQTLTDKEKNADNLFERDSPFERGGPFAPEPVFSTPAPTQDEVFIGTIELIRPLVDQKSKVLYLNVDVNVPNRQDKYGRWLLLQGLPVEATIIPEKRAE
jgi:multidrug resistance efflux pump